MAVLFCAAEAVVYNTGWRTAVRRVCFIRQTTETKTCGQRSILSYIFVESYFARLL